MECDNLDSGDVVPDLTKSATQFDRNCGEIKEKNFRFCVGDAFDETGPIRIVLIEGYRVLSEAENLKRFPPESFVGDIKQQVHGTDVS
jgi:hypothetical protein